MAWMQGWDPGVLGQMQWAGQEQLAGGMTWRVTGRPVLSPGRHRVEESHWEGLTGVESCFPIPAGQTKP
jgi:hypothetical protein